MSTLSAPLTVAVIDDDDGLRDALATMFDALGFSVVGVASAKAFQPRLDDPTFACALIDVRLPGIDGMALFRLMRDSGSRIPVIILTGHGDIPMAVEALKAGAIDFIEKPFDPDRLLDSVREALERDSEVRQDQAVAERVRLLIGRLTPREQEVMDLMVVGHSNKAIASRLGISPRTVEVHRARVMEKMAARSLAELVRMCLHIQKEPGT